MLRTNTVTRILVYIFLVVYVIIIVTPFLMIFMNSFKTLR